MAETIFVALGTIAVLSGLLCIVQRNALAAAIWLVVTMLALAGMYLILGAPFIAAIQVLVYAGAVMVLFIFVIMLLNLSHGPSDLRGPAAWAGGLVLAVALGTFLLRLGGYDPARLALELTGTSDLSPAAVFESAEQARQLADAQGVVGAVAGPLFSTYLVPFEVTSLLLLAAIVGAVVLAKKRI
ncbi:MAG TPA: NADH-quinone oxidoreductase subunit J [Gemmatimonadales bacterium]|nr:NADH-quinone oxidoreductase subunit J [Gemmatimonadales bacterium]